MKNFTSLYTPYRIGDVGMKNRIAMAPMGVEYMTNPDGSLNRRVIDFYLERIRGGVGLIISSVYKAENRIEALEESTPMLRETSLDALGEICTAAHAFGSRVFIQLTAGFGRVAVPATLRGECVSASDNTNFWDSSIGCRTLAIHELEEIVEAMGESAAMALLAGVDGIELHGHEGYLFDQFTSSIWNRRTDVYGGSLENRLRFPIACLERIRERSGGRLAVVYRFGLKHYLKAPDQGALPGEAFVEVGRELDEGLEMARRLEAAGFDGLHVDAGCYESHYWPHPPIYQDHGCMVDMAARAKEAVAIPVLGVGRLDVPEVAAEAVEKGYLDGVSIGRGLLAEPNWADIVRFGDIKDIRPCIGCYDGCLEAYSTFRSPSCAVNPASGRERTYGLEPADRPRKILVVGGGVAGMEAARVAAIRGHRVVLHERGDELGGLVRQAGVPEFKNDLIRLLDWYRRQVAKVGVDVHLSSETTPETALSADVDVVVVAVGADPMKPPVPGIEKDSVATAVDVLAGRRRSGNRPLVIGGGLAGCEVAVWLARMGKRPTVVEALPALMSGGAPVPMQVAMMTRDLLDYHEVPVMTGTRLRSVTDHGAVLADTADPGGREWEAEADSVVLAIGMVPRSDLANQLESVGTRVYRIGDCREPRNIMNAVWDAYEIARWL